MDYIVWVFCLFSFIVCHCRFYGMSLALPFARYFKINKIEQNWIAYLKINNYDYFYD